MLKKMAGFLFFFLLTTTIGLAAEPGQETAKLINLHDPHSSLAYTNLPVYISVTTSHLHALSSAPRLAEAWVIAHIPSPPMPTTTVVVGKGVFCRPHHRNEWGLVLPALRNMGAAIKNLGLERDVKVTAAFSSQCLESSDVSSALRPVLSFMKASNAQYLIDPPPHFSAYVGEVVALLSSHEKHIKGLGFSANGMGVIISHFVGHPNERRLSEPYPLRPKPLPEPGPPSPMHSSIGFSAPSDQDPIPPSPQFAAPPPSGSFSFVPESPPAVVPGSPLDAPPATTVGPPCFAMGPAPEPGETGKVSGPWCVAKPSVPSDVLQEAIDYACGEGEADCEEIKPHGSCYSPDSLVAHASYAFNSYWQKNKHNGGTCDFAGTAMLINSDPSNVLSSFLIFLFCLEDMDVLCMTETDIPPFALLLCLCFFLFMLC
ncbi:hypothetical protein ACLOJK_003592 [Asimina triloba]